MTNRKGGRPLSRRDLFGIFGRSTRDLRDVVARDAPKLVPGAAPPEQPQPSYERKLRPSDESLAAASDGQGGWIVDLRPRPLAVGHSRRVIGPGLAEPLLVVHVNEQHFGVVGGECPVDGSDLLFLELEDRVTCPSCASRWRLDGNLTRGPADCRLGTYLVDHTAELLRLRAI